ncbi:hypothetical protein DES34_10879 [Brevibacillus brevis]|nr:hypothetical protein DES34_10879 [Brevibacillus brevis]VEF90913.1 Uncharacterised protein [Brevibacillus brevis]
MWVSYETDPQEWRVSYAFFTSGTTVILLKLSGTEKFPVSPVRFTLAV